MGLFDKLFGKKGNNIKSKAQENPVKQNNFLTNAQEFGFDKIELGISGKVRVDGILAIAAFQSQAEAKGITYSYKVMYTSLLEEGALTVPIVINYGQKAYSLYFIYNEEDLLKFKDLQKYVSKTAYPELIYFSSIPIYEGYEAKPIIEPFQLADLRYDQAAELKGDYAMWWASAQDPDFHNSVTSELLNKLYEVLKGYETYLAGYIVRQTRVIDGLELQRLRLPVEASSFVLQAPEGKKVILDISQEKGIRFLFPTAEVTKEYRERFLQGVLVELLATRLYLQENNAEPDEELDMNGYDWFTYMAKMIKRTELEGERVNMIGGMGFS